MLVLWGDGVFGVVCVRWGLAHHEVGGGIRAWCVVCTEVVMIDVDDQADESVRPPGVIDSRQVTFVGGDQFHFSGNFPQANITIETGGSASFFDYHGAVGRVVEEYSSVFGGRIAELAMLDAFLDDARGACGLLLAPTGRGKTALLIRWVELVRARPGWMVVFVPVSRRFDTATAGVVLGLLVQGLARFFGESLQGVAQSSDLLRPQVAGYLRRGVDVGDERRLLVVLDGVDEAVGWEVDASLFPRTIGSGIKVVVSAREQAHFRYDDWLQRFGWGSVQTVALSLPLLRRGDVADVLRCMGDPLSDLAGDVDFLAELVRLSEGEPLTIVMLVRSLQAGEIAPGRLSGMTPGLAAVVRVWLDELERVCVDSPAVHALLSLCAVALGPLTAVDLGVLDAERFAGRARLNQAAKQVRRFVLGDGGEQGYVFSHPKLRELFVEEVLSDGERAGLVRCFVEYGRWWYDERAGDLPAYVRRFWVAHLRDAGEWSLMRRVLMGEVSEGVSGEQRWAAARYAAEGSYRGYLDDVMVLWGYAEEVEDLVLGVRCALVVAGIRSLSGHFSPSLLVGLVTVGTPEGRWGVAAALEYVRQMTDAGQQVGAIAALLGCGCALPLDQALEVASGIGRRESRAWAIGALAPYLPLDVRSRVLDEALAVAQALDKYQLPGRILERLVEHLQPDERVRVGQVALETVRSLMGERWCGEMLEEVLPALDGVVLVEALGIARALGDERGRLRVLCKAIPRVTVADRVSLVAEVAAMARSATDGEVGMEGLLALLPYLSGVERAGVVAEVLVMADAMGEVHRRLGVLVRVLRYVGRGEEGAVYEALEASIDEYPQLFASGRLPDDFPLHLLRRVFARVRVLPVERERVSALRSMVDRLPGDLIPDVLAEARGLTDVSARLFICARVLPRVVEEERRFLAAEVLDALGGDRRDVYLVRQLVPYLAQDALGRVLSLLDGLYDDRERAEVLKVLALHLPEQMMAEAWGRAGALADVRQRVVALAAFVERLPVGGRAGAYAEVLAAAQQVGDVFEQVGVFAGLAPTLPLSEQAGVYAQVFSAACAIMDPMQQWVVGGFVAELPVALQAQVREVAQTHGSVYVRALVLACPLIAVEERCALALGVWEAMCGRDDEGLRERVLGCIVPYLPGGLLPEVRAMAGKHWRSVFERLAKGLLPTLLVDVVMLVCAEAGDREREMEFLTLARDVPDGLLGALLAEAHGLMGEFQWAGFAEQVIPRLPSVDLGGVLALACALGDEGARAMVLRALLPRLSLDMVVGVLVEARRLTDGYVRVLTLAHGVSALPSAERARLASEVYDAALVIDDAERRLEVVGKVVAFLPLEVQQVVADEVVAVLALGGDARWQVVTLQWVVPYLSPGMVVRALGVVRGIEDAIERARGLQVLVSYATPEVQRVIVSDVLGLVDELGNDWYRALVRDGQRSFALPPDVLTRILAFRQKDRQQWVLQWLMPHVPIDMLPEVFDVVSTIDDTFLQARVLQVMLPRLPAALLPRVLDMVAKMRSTDDVGPLLAELAQRLPPEFLPAVLDGAWTVEFDEQGLTALQWVAPYLPFELLSKALGMVNTIDDWESCVGELDCLASHLARYVEGHGSVSRRLWFATMRQLAYRGRPVFFEGLAVLVPWLVALTSAEQRMMFAAAVRDMVRCWR